MNEYFDVHLDVQNVELEENTVPRLSRVITVSIPRNMLLLMLEKEKNGKKPRIIIRYTLNNLMDHIKNFLIGEKELYYDKNGNSCLFFFGHLRDIVKEVGLCIIGETKKVGDNEDHYQRWKDKR